MVEMVGVILGVQRLLIEAPRGQSKTNMNTGPVAVSLVKIGPQNDREDKIGSEIRSIGRY